MDLHLTSPDRETSREVTVRHGDVLTVDDGERKVYISFNNDGNLCVHMVDETRTLIWHRQETQASYTGLIAQFDSQPQPTETDG